MSTTKNKLLVIVPSYNEEKNLAESIKKLYSYLVKNSRMNFRIVIADNQSKDKTPEIAKSICRKNKRILYTNSKQKGKGAAIKNAMNRFDSDWYCFIDADLPVPLKYFSDLEKEILSGKNDLIIGCRHCKKGELIATTTRKITSFGYLMLAKIILFNFKIKDLQTGFKAWNNSVKKQVFLYVKDNHWFFDTELVYYAYNQGNKVGYFPVKYQIGDGLGKTKIKLFKDIWYFFKKLIELKIKTI
jgi:glycosyltransferase involved in cell wall biosynthesis